MKKIYLILLFSVTFLTLRAQHNYDNQSTIFSHSDNKVSIGNSTLIGSYGTEQAVLQLRDIRGGWLSIGELGNSINRFTLGATKFGNGLYFDLNSSFKFNAGGDLLTINGKNLNGFIGIGTNEPNANLHLSGGNEDVELILEADKDNVNEMDNPFITFSQDEGTVKGFIGLIGNNNTAPHVEKYPRFVNESGSLVQKTDYPGTLSNYLLIGTNNNEGVQLGANGNVRLTVNGNGNVGIGTISPNEKLSVNGTIRSKEVRIEVAPWPDYVFEDSYELKDLSQVENYILQNGHLPNIPSAEEVSENGIALGEMNAKLLEKIEELTLYVIDLKKENQALKENQVDIYQMIERLEKLENKPNQKNQ